MQEVRFRRKQQAVIGQPNPLNRREIEAAPFRKAEEEGEEKRDHQENRIKREYRRQEQITD
ncbi:hypothetical protein D3C76_1381420 [compost metagenome]